MTNNPPMYMFSIVRGTREARIYRRHGADEQYTVVCVPNEPEYDRSLDYCREIAEEYVMGGEW